MPYCPTPSIKKMARIFGSHGVARHALREVSILRHLSMCDNSTVLLDFDATFVEQGEIYLVMAPSEATLLQIIRSRQGLTNAHLQYFAVQILRGVRYMHAAHIVHRDLKPSNLLVNADCALRICDYGLARAWSGTSSRVAPHHHKASSSLLHHASSAQGLSCQFIPKSEAAPLSALQPRDGHQHPHPGKLRVRTGPAPTTRLFYPGDPLSGHVATRWYRAPEILLQFREGYGPEMDMWAVGCILAEILLGKPLFPGKDYVDQLTQVYNLLGSPSNELLAKSSSPSAQKLISSFGPRPAANLARQFPHTDPLAVDLLQRLLRWDPHERISADEALRHPWLAAYHESSAHWTPPSPFASFGKVEFSRSRSRLMTAFQTEAREMHAEWSALARESDWTADAASLQRDPHIPDDQASGSLASELAAQDACNPDQGSAHHSHHSADSHVPTGYGTDVTTPSANVDQSSDPTLGPPTGFSARPSKRSASRYPPQLVMTNVDPADVSSPESISSTPGHGLKVEPSSDVGLPLCTSTESE